jgi:hypothetical protein
MTPVPSAALTVGQLLETLRMLPADTPLIALFDCRMAEGQIVSVEFDRSPGNNMEPVALIIE